MAGKQTLRLRGAYTTDRAAALAGVPVSTVYYWARKGIYVPTLSSTRTILWSWGDLLALRAISWLRIAKPDVEVRATSMKKIRSFLHTVHEKFGDRLGDQLADKSIVLRVDSRGQPFVSVETILMQATSEHGMQLAEPRVFLDLLVEYDGGEGLRGPHLLSPRPRLRIIPGKLGGEPHILNTRIETRVIRALRMRGYEAERILDLYPMVDEGEVLQAIDLEEQLDRNLTAIAA